MSETFSDVIYLFACGARGSQPVLTHDVDVFSIYRLAMSQGIWPTTFLALKKLYDLGQLHVDKEIFNQWHQQIMIQAAQALKKNAAVSNAINALEQQGIQCCVLKGEVLSELYLNPICRISSDADILIDANLEKKAADVLQQNGFEVEPRHPTSNHVRCFHPIAGLIELHLHLYKELYEDVWFGQKALNTEPYRQIKTSQGINVTTLGINDGLIFITLHLIKHFLGQGVGIRQLMDVLLYMSHYQHEIDWDRYNKLLEYLKYNRFIANAVGIGVKYLGFAENELPKGEYNDAIMQNILTDMENGGLYGYNEAEREGFYKVYTEERFKRFKQGSYRQYMNGWNKPNYLKTIFLDSQYIAEKYPYVNKHKLLLYVAWLHRMLNFILDVFKREKKVKQYIAHQGPDNDVVKKRMDLIRELDMI